MVTYNVLDTLPEVWIPNAPETQRKRSYICPGGEKGKVGQGPAEKMASYLHIERWLEVFQEDRNERPSF